MGKVIESSGMRVIKVEDGNDALAKLTYRRPHLVLMDLHMPGIDGITTLQRMRSNPELRNVLVIMLTGDSSSNVVEMCKRLGVVDFIVKPSTPELILKKISAVLANHN
jgi:CheY-like chemotaxis protein